MPKHKQKASEIITDGLLSVAESGRIQSRDDVIKTLESAGFEIARTTPKTISIKDPDGGKNIRLKGMIYEQDFRFGKELRADIERASERYRASRSDRVQEARATLERLVTRKRESNELRYPRAEQTVTPDYVKNLEHRSHSRDHSHFSDVGNPSLSEPQNRQERRDNRPTEPSYTGLSEQGGQHQAERLHRQQRSQTLMRSSEQGCTDLAEWQLNGSDGVLIDDRIRKALTRSLGTSTGATTAEGSRFTQDVREYQARQSERQGSIQEAFREHQRNRPDPKRELEQISSASKQLELSSARLQDTKQSLDRAITGIRNASQQVKEMNEPKKSYGMRFG